MENFNETWQYICNYLKERISLVAYQTWISRIVPIKLDFSSGTAILEVPNEFHKSTLERIYSKLLNEAFLEIFSTEIKIAYTFPSKEKEEEKLPDIKIEEENNNDFTFENFIVGSSNKFAYAAAMAVAREDAKNYNPFFIYGNSGLGKTHLLHAISNEIRKRNPQMNIIYIKGDEFTNELINTIRYNIQHEFHQKYRKADVLLIDDIQFIAGKESTQEEFFHTFNTLYEANKQIVLTSDRPPRDIATLEDRLKTRFQWGLTADIQPPDFETRIAIIKRKAEKLNLEISDSVLEYIANHIKNNIRQLEGIIKKLNAYYLIQNRAPTINMAQLAISDIINNEQPASITVEKIIEEVARTFGVSPMEIKAKNQKAVISNARQVAMYVVRDILQIPYVLIGKEFGNRDHATVVYALQQIERKIKTDRKLKETIEDIIKNIRNQ